VSIVLVVGVILNGWVPFTFETIDHSNHVKYCDVAKDYSRVYFHVTISYIALTMLIPIVVIFVCNSFIMLFIVKASQQRAKMSHADITKKGQPNRVTIRLNNNNNPNNSMSNINNNNNNNNTNKNSSQALVEQENLMTTENTNRRVMSFVSTKLITSSSKSSSASLAALTSTQVVKNNRRAAPSNDSNKITRMLLLMSFSYAVLNLPYFISWCIFFYKLGIRHERDVITKNYLFAAIQFSEVFYVLNYGVHFFIYCFSGQRFRTLLKSAFTKK
jgi:hypothetical protein